MQVFYCDQFALPLPAGHRFPIDKYRLLRERLQLSEKVDLQFHEAPRATADQLARVHSSEYLTKALTGGLSELEQRRIGFPWSPAMLERCLRSTGASVATAQAAVRACFAARDGIAVHLSGGTHHAFSDAGQGFCMFNDVAVAIREWQHQRGQSSRAVVIDLDVHQGNGTAEIFRTDASVFTFSMHGERNYPFRKTEGDLDIALPDATGDEQYLDALTHALQYQLPLDSAELVFYLAGADPFAGDRMGRLSLTKSGLAQRDEMVISEIVSRNIPLAVVMAGGYASLEDVVDIHTQTVMIAVKYSRSNSFGHRSLQDQDQCR